MIRLIIISLLLLPLLTSAQGRPETFAGFVGLILSIIQMLVVAIFALTFFVLIWGIVKAWILHGGETKEVEEGKKIVTVGVIVLVIMSGLWGIVAMLRSGIFGL